jgi:hypothetical protein
MNKQLSLSLGVLGRERTEAIGEVYLKMIQDGYTHEQIETAMIEIIQDRFDEQIEAYCNKHMIYSNLKVTEDMVEELKQLTTN